MSRQGPPEHDPQGLSEVQLRQLYEEEEVERFLSLFSAHVTEIRLSPNVAARESHIENSSCPTNPPDLLHHRTGHSLSEIIAYDYLLPHLPPAASAAPHFTLKRFTLTLQRLYLAIFPPYQAFLSDLTQLALWSDYQRSLRHCVVFWFLWFHDLLLPALIFRIVFGLIRRRLSTYPTLKELQERRRETARAQKFGEAVQQRLSVTTIGPIEMWRLFRLYKSGEKDRVRSAVKDTMEADEEENLKRDVLFVLNELADFHERIKSVFTWRRPDVSRRYLFCLIAIGLGSVVLPARWIAKLIYWSGGVLFWHVTPIIAALPPADRARALPLFRAAPTDADCAMELIAKRITTGQDVDVASLRNQSRRASNASANTEGLASTSNIMCDVQSTGDDRINWKKWSERVARSKLFVDEGRRFLSPRASRTQISGETAPAPVGLGAEDAHTFLAQYASFPGLITLTPCTLFFTSLTGTHARLVIPRDRLRGVKRSGFMRGISITWAVDGTDGEEREDKFHWVGNRDELFARLSVGSDGGRWITMILNRMQGYIAIPWLAATLGSKSAFKKLPKRSVMTADISQLCRLIATPAEPLALRLSSNLLVGAARVYRVKQEIFMSDVTTCFNTLKRVEQELRSVTSSDQLQMAQPTVKSSTVTLRADPRTAFSMEFDAMVTDWDEYLNPRGNKNLEVDPDDEYHPTTKIKGKAATTSAPPVDAELLRATACTLPDNHEFLLANSFDASFGGSGAAKVSSSQIGSFAFDDTFDGLDIEEGVGDDLVRELGEGWGVNPIKENTTENLTQAQEMYFDAGDLDNMLADRFVQFAQSPQPHILVQDFHTVSAGFLPSPSLAETAKSVDSHAIVHPSRSPTAEPTAQPADVGLVRVEEKGTRLRRAKRVRAILDARTELTDEELKDTRTHYLDKQNVIRCELEIKRFEKQQVDMIHTLLWDAPGSLHAKELIDFWAEHFKAHVKARSGFLVELPLCLEDDSPRQKRRKISDSPLPEPHKENKDGFMSTTENWRADHDQESIAPMDAGDMDYFNYNMDVNWGDIDDYTPQAKNLRSSEEPGQARRTSHPPPTAGDNIGVDMTSDNFHSQRSALFPWDMAGNSSSISAHKGLQTDRISIEHADDRLRGSSASRRGSSLPSIPGNLQTSVGSPAVIVPVIQSDDDFVFDVPGETHALDTRQSEANRVALEKNSHNFLEYAKMQYKSLPNAQYLVFDDVVPKATSTARVAAAALYHCLVLATKNLLQVNQEEAYGRIDIRIV